MTQAHRLVSVGGAAAALVLAFSLSACTPVDAQSDSESDFFPNAIFDDIRAVNDGDLAYWPDKTLSEVLPNQFFSYRDGEPRSVVDGVVVGRVVEVSAGRAYEWNDDESEVLVLDDFDSKTADWKIVKARVEIERGLGEFDGIKTVEVGVTLYRGQSLAEATKDLLAIPEVLIPLSDIAFYDFDPALLLIHRSGEAFGVIRDGNVTFPAMEEGAAKDYVGDLDTLDEVYAAAEIEKSDVLEAELPVLRD